MYKKLYANDQIAIDKLIKKKSLHRYDFLLALRAFTPTYTYKMEAKKDIKDKNIIQISPLWLIIIF